MQQVLDVAQRQPEPDVEHRRQADDLGTNFEGSKGVRLFITPDQPGARSCGKPGSSDNTCRRNCPSLQNLRVSIYCTEEGGLCSRHNYVPPMGKAAETSVLYNANCPVCNFEIGHYARYACDQNLPIRFDDLNTDARRRWGLDADSAARRLFVLHAGELTSGIPAFLVLWSQMPRYRLLGRIVGLPGIRQIASAVYDRVLAPVIYLWHLRRVRRQTARTQT